MDDGCGGTLDCGGCGPGASCGGSGLPHVCGCSPVAGCLSEGLDVEFFVDRNQDGAFEATERVCDDLTSDDVFAQTDGTLALYYLENELPCSDIAPYERWGVEATGYLSLSALDPAVPAPPQVTLKVRAIVNDGARVEVLHPASRDPICLLELWSDVPQYVDNHSTMDCEATFDTEVAYPMRLSFYHQGDPDSPNDAFNRANLFIAPSSGVSSVGLRYLRD